MKNVDELRAEVDELNRRLQELGSRYVKGEVNSVEYLLESGRIESKLLGLHCEINFLSEAMSSRYDHHLVRARREAADLIRSLRSHSKVALAGFSVLVLVFAYLLYDSHVAEQRVLGERRVAYESGLLSAGPAVAPCTRTSFGWRFRDWDMALMRVASYNATVMVASKNYRPLLRSVSPVDLIFVWGEYANPENDRYLGFAQVSEVGTIIMKSGTPLSLRNPPGGQRPWCNVHIYPASEGVYEGVKAIEGNQVASFEGYLVNLIGRDKVVQTKLGPEDRFSRDHEYLYVERLTVGGRVYV